jgi:hypothetical protein
MIVQIDNLKLSFRCKKGCEEIMNDFIVFLKEHPGGVRRALYDMKNFWKIEPPKKLDVLMTPIIKVDGLEDRETGQVVGEAAGCFHDLYVRIDLSAGVFNNLKENLPFLENAHWLMMETFLHEIAHWATKDEIEADALANEWILAI